MNNNSKLSKTKRTLLTIKIKPLVWLVIGVALLVCIITSICMNEWLFAICNLLWLIVCLLEFTTTRFVKMLLQLVSVYQHKISDQEKIINLYTKEFDKHTTKKQPRTKKKTSTKDVETATKNVVAPPKQTATTPPKRAQKTSKKSDTTTTK